MTIAHYWPGTLRKSFIGINLKRFAQGKKEGRRGQRS
jgi:hypothetical protein